MHTQQPLLTDFPNVADSDGGADSTLGVLGVRGGVGTSTIAAALGAIDHGTDAAAPAYGSPVVLVTSPSVADTQRLLLVVDQCHVRGLGPIVVAVVSDGHGNLPAASRVRLRMIRDRVETVTVPWVGRWRWRGAGDRIPGRWSAAMAKLSAASGAGRDEGFQISVVARPRRRRRRRRAAGGSNDD